MPICYECRLEYADGAAAPQQWQYVTIDAPCDRCGAEMSHEPLFDDG